MQTGKVLTAVVVSIKMGKEIFSAKELSNKANAGR